MKPACTCHGPSMGPGQATCDQGGGHIWRRGQGVNQVTAQPVQGSVLWKGPRPCLTRPPPGSRGDKRNRGQAGDEGESQERTPNFRARRGEDTQLPSQERTPNFRPESTLIKDGGCGKSRGSKLISEESGAPRDQNRCGKYARSRIHSHLGGSESARAQPSRGPAKVQGPRPDFCKVGISDSAPQHGIWGAKSKRAPGCQPESCPVSDLGYLRSPCGGRRRRRRWSWRLP